MIVCDLPYHITAAKWDRDLNMDKLWEEYNRVIKPKGAIVLFASSKFVFNLYNSQPNLFRYKWIWKKNRVTGFLYSKTAPMRQYEEFWYLARLHSLKPVTLKSAWITFHKAWN